jgi:hypothetical protein
LTLLQICTNASDNIGVVAPTSIIGNTDPAAKRLLQLARRAAQSLRTRANWVSLVVEHVFIADGSTIFTLPSDFDRLVSDTMWDRTRFWRMRGAMSPQQWQMYKSSVFGRATIERRWRIRMTSGDSAGGTPVFEIDPAISATDTTSKFVFEYVTKSFCRSASTHALEEAQIASGGTGYTPNDILTLSGGTSTTAATLRVTEVSSGIITAAQVETPGSYTVAPTSPDSVTGGTGTGATFLIDTVIMPGQTQPDWSADTDVALLDEDLLELGVIWRLQQRLGLAYLEEKDEYERQVDMAVARDGGTAILDLVNPPVWCDLGQPGTFFSNDQPTTSDNLTLDGETLTLDGDTITLP